jgi:hypothetical protein
LHDIEPSKLGHDSQETKKIFDSGQPGFSSHKAYVTGIVFPEVTIGNNNHLMADGT